MCITSECITFYHVSAATDKFWRVQRAFWNIMPRNVLDYYCMQNFIFMKSIITFYFYVLLFLFFFFLHDTVIFSYWVFFFSFGMSLALYIVLLPFLNTIVTEIVNYAILGITASHSWGPQCASILQIQSQDLIDET